MITTNPFTIDNYMTAVETLKDIIAERDNEIERLREALRKIADEEKDCFPIQTARDALKEKE